VIEVGIDVPDATIIVIENSERFGLAQLHQLRGRVGRGVKKSYCLLLTTASAESDTTLRLKSFCSQHDGFAVAEMDLRNRGPGEVTGFRQSGWDDLIVADILRDADLFSQIIKEIDEQISRYFVR
jgi:ATP-dependent DNA helicase RecG